MPQLPDLEVFGQNLNKKLKGKKVSIMKSPGGRITYFTDEQVLYK